MHDRALELIHAGEVGLIAVVVAVVAAAREHEAARELDDLVGVVRSAVMRHCASSVDQSALTMRWLNRIFSSMPSTRAVSLMYCRIDAPSAIDFSPSHGRNE